MTFGILAAGGGAAATDPTLDADRAEAYAQLLLDHPARRTGDRDALFLGWLDALEAEPDHPLAEALLTLYADNGIVQDPTVQSARLREMSSDGLPPLAAHLLEVLQAENRLARDPPDAFGEDLFPTTLRSYSVLVRRAPLDDPLALLDPDGRVIASVNATGRGASEELVDVPLPEYLGSSHILVETRDEIDEIAALLEVSEMTVGRHWAAAKVWLYRALEKSEENG